MRTLIRERHGDRKMDGFSVGEAFRLPRATRESPLRECVRSLIRERLLFPLLSLSRRAERDPAGPKGRPSGIGEES